MREDVRRNSEELELALTAKCRMALDKVKSQRKYDTEQINVTPLLKTSDSLQQEFHMPRL